MSTESLGGRAGRLRLRHRLDTARRAAELLHRKERLVAAELVALEQFAVRSSAEWTKGATDAARWLRRSADLSGHHSVTVAAPGSLADLHVHTRATVGGEYADPERLDVSFPEPSGPVVNSALTCAVVAHRHAVRSALHHAAAARAVAVVAAELTGTRTRRRALRHRRIPQLEGAAALLDLQLDEMEREDHLRLRRLARSSPPP